MHLNNSPVTGYDDWLPAARLARVPCVVYGMGPVHRISNPMRRSLVRGFDAYFPVSRLVRGGLERNGIDPDRVVINHPGVDVEHAKARAYRSRADVRSEFGLRHDQILAVMVGNVRKWKGQHVVTEALARLTPDERRRLKLLMIGEGGGDDRTYEQELEGAVDRYGLSDVVAFTGRREDVPDLLEAADIAIHASIVPEPFGLVVQEAMLHGCATIAANQGGPAEMMTDESGLLFVTDVPEELTRHLRTLMNDDEARARLSHAARAQATTLDVRDHVARIERRYARLLG